MTDHDTINTLYGKETSAQQALEASEKRFQMLIEQAPEAFFVHDSQGHFLQVNGQTCRQLGYSRQELLQMSAGDVQRGVEPDLAKILWQKVLAGETVIQEDVLQRKDGSTFIAEVKIGLFENDGSIEIFGFFRDISDLKKREEEKEALILRLQNALDEVKQLSGLLPICGHCHKIRDDEGYWNKLETYIQNHSDVSFSHGICPECLQGVYAKMEKKKNKKMSDK